AMRIAICSTWRIAAVGVTGATTCDSIIGLLTCAPVRAGPASQPANMPADRHTRDSSVSTAARHIGWFESQSLTEFRLAALLILLLCITAHSSSLGNPSAPRLQKNRG